MKLDQMSKEMYKKIIHIKEYLSKSHVKEKNSLGLYGTVNYVLDEYIGFKGVGYKQRITKKMLMDIDKSYENNEIDLDPFHLSVKELDLLQHYISHYAPRNIDTFNLITKLQIMKNDFDDE